VASSFDVGVLTRSRTVAGGANFSEPISITRIRIRSRYACWWSRWS